MLHSADISIGQSALLVIDAQDSFKLGPRWEKRDNRHFERNVASLIAAYRAAKLPVFYFLHSDPDPGFATDSPFYKLMDFIVPAQNEPVLEKITRNCFTSTPLMSLLVEKGVRRLCITGIQMEQCCETTARVAADLGFAVDFMIEGTMTFPIPHREKEGKELGVDEIRERTEYALRGRFAALPSLADHLQEVRDYKAA